MPSSAEGARPHVFRSAQEAELSLHEKKVALHDLAEYRRRHRGDHVLTTVGRIGFQVAAIHDVEEIVGADRERPRPAKLG